MTQLLDLPEEVIIHHILTSVDDYYSLVRFSLTSKRSNDLFLSCKQKGKIKVKPKKSNDNFIFLILFLVIVFIISEHKTLLIIIEEFEKILTFFILIIFDFIFCIKDFFEIVTETPVDTPNWQIPFIKNVFHMFYDVIKSIFFQ